MSLQLVPGPLKEQPGNRGTLRAALRSGETESPETSLLTVSVEAQQQCLQSTHMRKGSFWVLCEVSPGKGSGRVHLLLMKIRCKLIQPINVGLRVQLRCYMGLSRSEAQHHTQK